MIYKVQAMAMKRKDALVKAGELGFDFVTHFAKAYIGCHSNWGHNYLEHWSTEMINYLNQVIEFKLKPNGRSLTLQEYEDWFFYNGMEDSASAIRFAKRALRDLKFNPDTYLKDFPLDAEDMVAKYATFVDSLILKNLDMDSNEFNNLLRMAVE